MGKEEAVQLTDLAPRKHPPHLVEWIKTHPEFRRGAEVGVYRGRTLLYLLQQCPKLHMLAVDAWENVEDSEGSRMYFDADHETNEAYVRLIASTFPSSVSVLKGLSWEMAREVDDESLDFVFIDASHMYEEVKKDIEAWGPKVRKGGFICGHDYCDEWAGVKRAVDDLLGTPNLLPETMWFVEK